MIAKLSRRTVVLAGAAAAAAAGCAPPSGETQMYGLIGKFTAVDGQRDALIQILLDGVSGLPGNLSYVIARDPNDANAIWITEVWESKAAHAASLEMDPVKEAIAKGRPLIAGMDRVAETEPVGGHGI